MKKINFNRVDFQGNEKKYIEESIENGHISGDGFFTKACDAYFESQLGIKKSLLTTSCTHALEIAALLIGIEPGDEIIVPSYTFVSTINAFVLRGAKPVFIDIRSDTLNMDESKIEKLITSKTKAIVPVHYAGVGCEMDQILEIAKKHNLVVIEDNAHGLFGKYKGKYLGTFGDMATQSFHETKNFSCGEGGAIFFNESSYIDRAKIIREKGTNRSAFLQGQVDKYTWVDVGSSYLPSDLLAAFLLAQIERRQEIQKKRKNIWNNYNQRLKSWAMKNNVKLPYVPEYCDQAYHMFYIVLENFKIRKEFMDYMKNKGILAVFHYVPLHSSEMGLKISANKNNCPITSEISERLVRLPFYNNLSIKSQDYVIEKIKEF
tara:strand:- start:22 stop:1149 length:1128 start_codon:yes stop_codon:yes gene_type:complete